MITDFIQCPNCSIEKTKITCSRKGLMSFGHFQSEQLGNRLLFVDRHRDVVA